MEGNKRLYINPTIEKQIRDYCKINEIEDINAFANRCAMQGLNIMKYGTSPIDNVSRENNGIKDIKKNDSKRKEVNLERQNEAKPSLEGGIEEEPTKGGEEKKEEVRVKTRRIQVIKKS